MMPVGASLIKGEHRGHAAICGSKKLRPVVTGTGSDHVGGQVTQLRPSGPVVLVGEVGAREANVIDELGVKVRFDWSDGQIPPVRALVDVVKVSSTIE